MKWNGTECTTQDAQIDEEIKVSNGWTPLVRSSQHLIYLFSYFLPQDPFPLKEIPFCSKRAVKQKRNENFNLSKAEWGVLVVASVNSDLTIK